MCFVCVCVRERDSNHLNITALTVVKYLILSTTRQPSVSVLDSV